jgi:beta-galactosidase/beta-glucuronidase
MQSLPHEFGLTALSVLTRDSAPHPARIRRETLVLDGTWSLSVDGAPTQPVQVPFAPQARVNAIPVPEGEARLRYATAFELPSGWEGALLHFEGVDREAEVSLNGVALGRHAGAWDPFSFWVPPAVLRRGLSGGGTTLHALVVEARDDSRDRSILAGKQERTARA